VEEVAGMGASVAAIAVTATFSQMAFAEHFGIEIPLLSDWGGRTAEAYGVRYDVWKGHEGLAKRSVFVIDRDGVVRYRWVTDDALVLPDLNEPIEVLKGLA
jgi:peroxiredoxin